MEIQTGNQLKGYISREIKDVKMHSNYGYNYYFCRNFLERLYGEHPENFILKGSFCQFANLKEFTRPLTDIDIVTYKKVEDAVDVVEDLLNSKSPIEYTIKEKFITTNATVNYRVLCKFDQITHLIEIDLKKEYQENDIKKENMPVLFSKDKEFEVDTIGLEEHLANKLYITFLNLELYELGKKFRRFKDFYDIQSILRHTDIDSNIVAKRLYEKIKADDFLKNYQLTGNLFNEEFIKNNIDQYQVDAKKYEYDSVSFTDAVNVTNEYISRIK